jgi:hypothetical protein
MRAPLYWRLDDLNSPNLKYCTERTIARKRIYTDAPTLTNQLRSNHRKMVFGAANGKLTDDEKDLRPIGSRDTAAVFS